MREGLA